jgi:hypothetical protein
MSYYSMSGFGALAAFSGDVVFDAEAVWADQVAGAAGDNFKGKRWAKVLQGALNDVGNYGLVVDGSWGPASGRAWSDFASKHNLTASKQPTSKADLIVLQGVIDPSSVGKPGGAKLTNVTTSGGEIVPTGKSAAAEKEKAAGAAKAGLSTGAMLGIAAVAVGGIALLAFMAKKKKPAGPRPPADVIAMVPNAKHKKYGFVSDKGMKHAKKVLSKAQFKAFEKMVKARAKSK